MFFTKQKGPVLRTVGYFIAFWKLVFNNITPAHISPDSLFIVLIHVGCGLPLLLVPAVPIGQPLVQFSHLPHAECAPAISTASSSDTRPHMLRQMPHVRHHFAHGLAFLLPFSVPVPCFQILSRILILSRYYTSSPTRTEYIWWSVYLLRFRKSLTENILINT